MSDNHDTASMQDHIRVYLMVFGALGNDRSRCGQRYVDTSIE